MFNGNFKSTTKLFISDLCVVLITYGLSRIVFFSPTSYIEWIECAFFEMLIVCMIGATVYGISYVNNIKELVSSKINRNI